MKITKEKKETEEQLEQAEAKSTHVMTDLVTQSQTPPSVGDLVEGPVIVIDR